MRIVNPSNASSDYYLYYTHRFTGPKSAKLELFKGNLKVSLIVEYGNLSVFGIRILSSDSNGKYFSFDIFPNESRAKKIGIDKFPNLSMHNTKKEDRKKLKQIFYWFKKIDLQIVNELAYYVKHEHNYYEDSMLEF